MWKEPAVPRHVIQLLVIDYNGRILLMHRSNNVRSARNVWSMPTGLQEIGETILDCAIRELKEEYGLNVERLQLLTQYENISGDPDAVEQYHWVMSLHVALVEDITKAVNKEPDKHDDIKFLPLSEFNHEMTDTYRFHESLERVFRLQMGYLIEQLQDFIQD